MSSFWKHLLCAYSLLSYPPFSLSTAAPADTTGFADDGAASVSSGRRLTKLEEIQRSMAANSIAAAGGAGGGNAAGVQQQNTSTAPGTQHQQQQQVLIFHPLSINRFRL